MATVLFVCLHNAGRSQMSQALLERAAQSRHLALSAGREADPDGHVHPEVVEVMRELDVDLADRKPQPLTFELAQRADVVVTMGCGDAFPHPREDVPRLGPRRPQGPTRRGRSCDPGRHRSACGSARTAARRGEDGRRTLRSRDVAAPMVLVTIP